jgi:hypothetical protein
VRAFSKFAKNLEPGSVLDVSAAVEGEADVPWTASNRRELTPKMTLSGSGGRRSAEHDPLADHVAGKEYQAEGEDQHGGRELKAA